MEKRTLFLAGDSTVQSYREDRKPMAGWGQLLAEYFEPEPLAGGDDTKGWLPGCDWMGRGRAAASAFEQSICYETRDLRIDNRAMAGRSSRSFWEEGRLADIEGAIKPGDYLFLQFAHNDANQEKAERYVTLEQYGEYLLRYVRACQRQGGQPVLVTAIVMRGSGDRPEGRFAVSFPQYRDKMLEIGDNYDIPVLDLGKRTADYCSRLGQEETGRLFVDNAHLQGAGARAFAGLLAELICKYDRDGRLDALKRLLRA